MPNHIGNYTPRYCSTRPRGLWIQSRLRPQASRGRLSGSSARAWLDRAHGLGKDFAIPGPSCTGESATRRHGPR
eukprot:8609160-Pyramimonas_sp.AAC.1